MTGSDYGIQQTLSSRIKTSKLSTPLIFPTKNYKKQNNNNKSRKMATTFLSTAKPFLSSSTPSSLSSLTNRPLLFSCPQQKCNPRRPLTSCKALSDESLPVPAASPIITKRSLSICFLTSFVFSLASRGSSSANAAILEADDDEELLEKVKRDRKKRLERQGVISSANKEKGYILLDSFIAMHQECV